MSTRKSIVLMALFFGGLLGLWAADVARVPTSEESRRRAGRVLPELMDVPTGSIRRVEILGGPRRIAFERRGDGWRMVEPVDAAADRPKIDALLQSLRVLPRPADGLELTGPPGDYGLDPPTRTIRVFQSEAQGPIASLEVGRTIRDGRYVRPVGSGGVEVVDAAPLAGIEGSAASWRDRALFRLPTFQVQAFEVRGHERRLAARRVGDRWRLTAPIDAPGATPKVEGLLASLAGLRAIDGDEAFVADGVEDFAPYGLDDPSWVLDLSAAGGESLGVERVQIGAAVPGRPGHVYARRAAVDGVVIVDAAFLDELEEEAHAFRARRVSDLDPARVVALRIDAGGVEHRLARGAEGWRVLRPVEGDADPILVGGLISELTRLETGELLEPGRVGDPGLDPPAAVISAWEGDPARARPDPPEGPPALRLSLGRRNGVARVLYATAEGDPAILALPIDALRQPFGDRLAFLDHHVLPGQADAIRRIARRQGDRTVVVEAPEDTRDDAAWRLVEPIPADVDRESVGLLRALLGNLRADRLVEQGTPDPARFGLDAPRLTITWAATDPDGRDSEHTLRLGGASEDGGCHALVEGIPLVFTLGPKAVEILEAELHDRRVLDIPPAAIERVAFRAGGREAAFLRSRRPFTGGTEWTPEPGTSPSRIDPAELDRFLATLTALRADRLAQYVGAFPAESGLDRPSLTIELSLKGTDRRRVLRYGDPAGEGRRFAATDPGGSGKVFVVPEPGDPWRGPFRDVGAAAAELPSNPFASGP